jgi:hypothetical protein
VDCASALALLLVAARSTRTEAEPRRDRRLGATTRPSARSAASREPFFAVIESREQ